MRILLLSFYYPPDLCAGSFRAHELAKALATRSPGNVEVEVMTTTPNRYASYAASAPEVEQQGAISIRRLAIPPHQSGMRDQALAFGQFALRVYRQTRGRQYDLVLATSSRLMTAFLGARVARRCRAPLYLDIRDIFSETMQDVLAGRALGVLLPFIRWIERHTVRSARRINLVSEGFRAHFAALTPGADFSFFTNGIDEEFIACSFEKPAGQGLPIVLYAGNIGSGQGLHRILPEAAKQTAGAFRFQVIGDGGMRLALQQALLTAGITNVELLDPVPRERLITLYKEADYLLLHLNDYPAFRSVLPSKLFEYAATGKPIIAGVAGYARDFIDQNIENAAVFDPCDTDGLVQALRRLKPDLRSRRDFIDRFRRRTIMSRMADDILACAQS